MDSFPGEDPTLPVELNGSVNISQLPDVSGAEIHIPLGGGGGLPDVAEDTISPTRARTMKDFENQIGALRKENFNLKLRIYYHEEQMRQKFDGPSEEIYRNNIELRVESESLKQELQEKQQLLIKASEAMESLTQCGDAEIQCVKEQSHKVQQIEENLTSRINLLEEDLKTAHKELEKARMMTEQERALRMAADRQLSLIPNIPPKDLDMMAALEEKDRCIEQLRISLKNKEALILHLEEESKSQSVFSEENSSAEKSQALTDEKEKELEAVRTEFENEKNNFEKQIQSLQEKLHKLETELSVERRNALKRDKTIQGLTFNLKVKENENKDLSSELQSLNASLVKAREATHNAEMQTVKDAEDYRVRLAEKETLLAELQSENRAKDMENHKLQQRMEKIDQELTDLLLEREKMVKELEEAQLQTSRSDKTINDLRNQVEKSHDKMVEKDKVVEHHYNSLLSESNQKLESQELDVANLMDSASQKNQMLQGSEYAEVMEALRKERGIFSKLIKLLKEDEGINNLQAELNNIFQLRKQLEDNILANWKLRKELEEQIKANKGEDPRSAFIPNLQEETLISWCDQTSYMSLGEQDSLNLRIDQLSLEELKKKVIELLLVLKELHSVNQDLKQKQLDGSKLDSWAKEALQPLDKNEFPERREESKSQTEAYDEEMSTLGSQRSEVESKQATLSDSSYKQSWNSNKLEFERDPAVGECFGEREMSECEAQERSSLVSLFNESGAAILDSGQKEMKSANKLLDHLSTTEQDSLSENLENKDEKHLKQLIIQLRAELQHYSEVIKFLKQQVELKSALTEKALLDPAPALGINANIELSKAQVIDSATQTMVVEGKGMGVKHEGNIASSEDKGKSSRLNRKREQWQERADLKNNRLENLSVMNRTSKSDASYPAKKSRLPILLRPTRSLGSIPLSLHTQKHDMHLQHRTLTLDEDLKDKCEEPQSLLDESELNGDANRRHEQKILVGAESLTQLDCSETTVSFSFVNDSKEEMEMEASDSEQHHPASKVVDEELYFLDKPDVDSATTFSGSKSLRSVKLSVTSTDPVDGDTRDDVQELRQMVKDLKADLAKYRMLLLHMLPVKHLLPRDVFSIVQVDGELSAESPFLPGLDIGRQEAKMISSGHQKIGYQIHIENLISQDSEKVTIEKLKEPPLENEAELEKEQITNMHLLDEVNCLQSKLKGISPLRYDPSILSLAHDHSSQRLMLQKSHSICVTYHQHLTNLIKVFEELLQASKVDYYIAEAFREQLNESIRLFERLVKQCLYGESLEDEMTQLYGVARSLSHSETAEYAPMLTSPEHKQEGVEWVREQQAVELAKFPTELLMEHIQETRMLRHQLEESLKTNDLLRKQLELHVAVSSLDQGSANVCIPGSEQYNSMTSEIHFLRKQNQTLNVTLAKRSQDREKEKLRESLSKEHVIVERLHKDYEHMKKENEKLQKQLGKQEEENGQLTNEVYNIRNELNRLQLELEAKQHHQLENEKLLHSLQLELKVYEKLDEKSRSQKDLSPNRSNDCGKDQNSLLDLHELLTEIRNLRTEFERSSQANKTLHEILVEQLSRGRREKASPGSTVNINYLLKQEVQQYTGINEFKFPTADNNVLDLQQKYGCCTSALKADTELSLDGLDRSSQSSFSAIQSHESCVFPRHCVWADKNGRHVLGLVEDYNSLWKQISKGQKLLSKLELSLKAIDHRELGVKDAWQAYLDRHSATISAVRGILEEAARLLKLLWRVSLPMKVVHSAAYSLQDESVKAELHQLQRKLAEQEKALHSTTMCLHTANQLKENMEKVIINQLALTHGILKKARENLEVQPEENKASAASSSTDRAL